MNRARLVTSPHGTLVHLDWLNVGRTDDTVRSTSCGRRVPATWSMESVTDAHAVQRVTCPSCAAWARYHQVAELAAAVAMPDARRELFATDAASSTQRHAELVELLAPQPQDARLAMEAAPAGEQFGQAPSASCPTGADSGRRAVIRAGHARTDARTMTALRGLSPQSRLRMC